MLLNFLLDGNDEVIAGVIIGVVLTFFFAWKYNHSRSLSIGLSTYNNNGGVVLSMKSGASGLKLVESHFEQLIATANYAVSANSKYF